MSEEPADLTLARARFDQFVNFAKAIGSRMRAKNYHLRHVDYRVIALEGLWDSCLRHHGLSDDQFMAIAATRIRGAIQDELRATDPLPRRIRNEQIEDDYKFQLFSLDTPPTWTTVSGWENILAKVMEPGRAHEDLETKEQLAALSRAIDCIRIKRHRYIIRCTLSGRPQHKIARDLGVSQPRVNQMTTTAIRNIRRALASPSLFRSNASGETIPPPDTIPPSPAGTPHR